MNLTVFFTNVSQELAKETPEALKYNTDIFLMLIIIWKLEKIVYVSQEFEDAFKTFIDVFNEISAPSF